MKPRQWKRNSSQTSNCGGARESLESSFQSMENVSDRKPKPKQSAKKKEEEIAKMVKGFRKHHA